MSNGVVSSTCSRTRQRSMWRRNRCPRPLPSAAPSTRPGTSARTTSMGAPSAVSPARITPRWGVRVVKGHASMRGRAAETRAISDDLPADGKPTSPTSAITFSSSRSETSGTCSPCSAKRGSRRWRFAKATLPRPPRPPFDTVTRWPWRTMSATGAPVSRSRTTVPTGTDRTLSRPAAPDLIWPAPWLPSSPRWWGCRCRSSRDVMPSSPSRITSPPRPPSPPSGPPRGTWASRRNETDPLPPRPPRTWIVHSSTNSALGAPRGALAAPAVSCEVSDMIMWPGVGGTRR